MRTGQDGSNVRTQVLLSLKDFSLNDNNVSAGECLSPAQVCDGSADCGAGAEDEDEAVCSGRECRHGLRCEETGQCLHSPHRQLCTGLAIMHYLG